MPEDVRLQSLDFKCYDDNAPGIASVKVTLSHGYSSDVIEKIGIKFRHSETI